LMLSFSWTRFCYVTLLLRAFTYIHFKKEEIYKLLLCVLILELKFQCCLYSPSMSTTVLPSSLMPPPHLELCSFL
jgi:hypothetical protein